MPLVTHLPNVAHVQKISKEQAWATFVTDLGLSAIERATEQLEGNPLVDELQVKARTSQDVPKLAEKLAQIPGVDDVQYMDDVIKRMQQLNQGLSWVSLAITSMLILT